MYRSYFELFCLPPALQSLTSILWNLTSMVHDSITIKTLTNKFSIFFFR